MLVPYIHAQKSWFFVFRGQPMHIKFKISNFLGLISSQSFKRHFKRHLGLFFIGFIFLKENCTDLPKICIRNVES